MGANAFTQLVLDLFIISAILITAYTCNFYYLALLSSKRKEKHGQISIESPSVTIQLPIYNEKYVAARLVDSVCALDYPKEKMRIMVLDDSDDDTVELVGNLIDDYKRKGFFIEHVRRGTRSGYKAGALKHAMKSTDTEFVAIFDADFMPPSWFLKKSLSHFTKPNIGLIQCRWGHANENYSAITQVQALSLDFHFLIEQTAKSNSHLFMNFNGTAGVWRRECIEDAGGWHTATLVEDLDLSYRAQMKGWKCVFLPNMVINAEIPVQMNAAKRQQFRWAKGSIQCAIKLLAGIAIKRKIAIEAKIQAFIQLTRHIVFPLMLIQFLTLPILLASDINLYIVSFLPALTIGAYLAMGPGAYILVMQKMYPKSWKSRAKILPSLMVYSFGMSVNNTIAVFDAVFGKKSEFLRTPKYGIIKNSDDWRDKAYNLPFTKTTLLEIFFGIYGILGIFISIFSNNPFFAPIIGIQTVGFLFIAYLSLSHSRFQRNKSHDNTVIPREERMANRIYRLSMIGILAIIIFGAFMAFDGYGKDVYPLDLARGHLTEITRSTEPLVVITIVEEVKANLPAEGNPVWIFKTSDTDFGIMQAQLDEMSNTALGISRSPVDSSAYHTGMASIKLSAIELRESVMDATPYKYVSISNIVFSTMWIAVIIGIFAVLKRKKDNLQEYDVTQDV